MGTDGREKDVKGSERKMERKKEETSRMIWRMRFESNCFACSNSEASSSVSMPTRWSHNSSSTRDGHTRDITCMEHQVHNPLSHARRRLSHVLMLIYWDMGIVTWAYGHGHRDMGPALGIYSLLRQKAHKNEVKNDRKRWTMEISMAMKQYREHWKRHTLSPKNFTSACRISNGLIEHLGAQGS